MVALRRDVPARSRFRLAGLEERCEHRARPSCVDYESLLRIVNEHDVRDGVPPRRPDDRRHRQPLAAVHLRDEHPRHLQPARGLPARRGGGPVERIVVASSDKAYGDHDELPYREDFALQPRYPYDVSKAAADLIARSYATPTACRWRSRGWRTSTAAATSTSRAWCRTRRARCCAGAPGDPLGRHARARLHVRGGRGATPTWRWRTRSTGRSCTGGRGTPATAQPVSVRELVSA